MHSVSHPVKVSTAVLAVSSALFCEKCRGEFSRPNVLVFLMDDMGIGDTRVYWPEAKVTMPHLEGLARKGMVFTDAHSPSSVCAPTRYSLLTGNYPWRGRNENGTWMFNQPSQILPGQQTTGDLLKNAGYRTAFFGKAHLGGTVYSKTTGEPLTGWTIDYTDIDFSRRLEDGPLDHGFDSVYELPNGIQGKPYAFFENGKLVGDPETLRMWEKGRYGNSVIEVNGFGVPEWDSSQAGPILTEKAVGFLRDHFRKNREVGTRRPFYMHYCSQSCHYPHTPPEELMGDPVKGVSGLGPHLDMLVEADLTLGKLIEELDHAGELENTLILFTSDNGGLIWDEAMQQGHNSSGDLRGAKAVIWEGGHRVPFIVRWDRRVDAGSRSAQLIGLQDVYATLAELTGQLPDAGQGLDSCSFLPVLTGEQDAFGRQTLFVQSNVENQPGQRFMKMVREGDWKLITDRNLKPVELYNLDRDPQEKQNLIHHPEQQVRIQRMHAEIRRIMNSRRSTPLPQGTRK